MTEIWKYKLPPMSSSMVELPVYRIFRALALTPSNGFDLWYEVDPDSPVEMVMFEVVGTGQEIPKNGLYLGTTWYGSFVYHVYELYDDSKPGYIKR